METVQLGFGHAEQSQHFRLFEAQVHQWQGQRGAKCVRRLRDRGAEAGTVMADRVGVGVPVQDQVRGDREAMATGGEFEEKFTSHGCETAAEGQDRAGRVHPITLSAARYAVLGQGWASVVRSRGKIEVAGCPV